MKNPLETALSTYQARKARRLERRGEQFTVVPNTSLEASEIVTGMLIESLCVRDEVIERLYDMLEAGEPTDRVRKELEASIRKINEFEMEHHSIDN